MARGEATGEDAALAELADSLLALEPALLVAWLDTQPPDVVSLSERALGRHLSLGWRSTPATMAHHLDPSFKLWRYTRLLGGKFRDAVTGRSTRQIWNLPARYGKSLNLRWGFVWAFDREPSESFIYTTYGDDLADEGSDFVRQQLRTHAAVLRAQLRRDRQRIDRFVTEQGGGFLAAGMRSGIPGFGANGLALDDPLKGWPEAHSKTERDFVWNQYRAVLRMRLDYEPGWIIVCHTRWHEDDPSGRLIKGTEDETGEAWELVRLPAVAEDADPTGRDPLRRIPDLLGRQPGELLEPERFNAAAVAARHLSLGSYLTAALEQQRPAPEEGGELKRAWWRLEDRMPTTADDALTSWDMKLKDKETGDFVVGQAWCRTGKDFWLLDQLRGQWNQPTTENAIALMAIRFPWIRRHLIENTGNGPEVIEALRAPHPDYEVSDDVAGQLGMTELERQQVTALRRRGLSGVLPNNPKGPKPVRARAVSGYVEAGDVHLPRHATWLGIFLDETAAFPNGSNDDQVDAFSQGVSKLARAPATASAARGELGARGARPMPDVARR